MSDQGPVFDSNRGFDQNPAFEQNPVNEQVRVPPAQSDLGRWLSRPGLVDDLHRLVQAEPEIIAVLMAACARHPAPITTPSPIPAATPFTVVFLEQVSEAIQQGIPDDEPPIRLHQDRPATEPDLAVRHRQPVVWEPERITREPVPETVAPEPPSVTPWQAPVLNRPHGRVFDPDEVTLDHEASPLDLEPLNHEPMDHEPLAPPVRDIPLLRPSRVLHPDEIIEDE